MISEELKAIIDRINEQGKMAFLEGAKEDQIAQFEKDHKVILPKTYKEWHQHSDGGEFFLPAGIQLYGVAHKPLIDIEEDDRPNDNYIVIGALASGDPVLCEKSGEKIALYDNETGSIDDELVYDDFFALLNDLYYLLGKENKYWFQKEKEQGIGLRSSRRIFLIRIKEKPMTRTDDPLKGSI